MAHLQVLQRVQAGWDFSQFVVVQMNLSDTGDAGQAPVFYKLDLVESEPQPVNIQSGLFMKNFLVLHAVLVNPLDGLGRHLLTAC